MNPDRTLFLVLLFATLTIGLGGAAVLATLNNRASTQLLMAIRQVEPGMPISTVRERLGNEIGASDNEATLRDTEFRKGKNLYWFYESKSPARVVEVYTDQDDRVVFVTWHGL